MRCQQALLLISVFLILVFVTPARNLVRSGVMELIKCVIVDDSYVHFLSVLRARRKFVCSKQRHADRMLEGKHLRSTMLTVRGATWSVKVYITCLRLLTGTPRWLKTECFWVHHSINRHELA